MGNVIKLFNFRTENGYMDIFNIANTFLSFESMSNKKLQKLCYYAQAWYVALNDEELIDCDFQAWTHGPVCPELYHRYKYYGYSKIKGDFDVPECVKNDSYLLDFLNSIYSMYGDFTADELEEMTHNEEPWLLGREGLDDWEPGYNTIALEDMRNYYKKLRDNN